MNKERFLEERIMNNLVWLKQAAYIYKTEGQESRRLFSEQSTYDSLQNIIHYLTNQLDTNLAKKKKKLKNHNYVTVYFKNLHH